jgi:alanine dehydrogenase
VDLSVDPYDCGTSPPAVKAIEGVPQGNLDTYVMPPDHPAWNEVPACVSTDERRTAVSCYSWPGIHPQECMEVYGKQIFPLVRVLTEAGGAAGVRSDGTYFHRALSRAMLSRWNPSS